MAFFEELTKKAKDLAGVASEKAKDIAEVAAEKAKNASETAKTKMAIATEQREVEKNYKAIGEWFVSEFEGEVPDAVKDVVAAINASKAKIAELSTKAEEAVEETVEKVVEAAEEIPELKTCPVCGAVSNSKFCPDCCAPMDAKEE